jgi:methylenetetrahydrofolate reductase (NADPH)
MSRILVELVPRNKSFFIEQLQETKEKISGIDAVNIPDICRCDLNSIQASFLAKDYFRDIIPHIRAAYFDLAKEDKFHFLVQQGIIKEILIIRGDPTEDEIINTPEPTLELIKAIRRKYPDLRVYAGIDQYRTDFDQEYNYIQQKIAAGAQGFFTQPFFDIQLMDWYYQHLGDVNIFWGVSPVTSLRAQKYWEQKNKVIFPENFEATLSWSKDFARKALNFVRQRNMGIYFMPIRTSAVDYLADIL